MIIFFKSGRLGNQLFQYCAIKKFQKNTSVVTVGMQEFKSLFTGVDIVGASWSGKLIEKIVEKIGRESFARIARKGLVSSVQEIKLSSGVHYQVTQGLTDKIIYFDEGYYQAENIVDPEIINRLSLKEDLLVSARKVLEQVSCRPEDCFFVHIRRGDYFSWPTPESPAILPSSWYLAQIAKIRERVPNAHFIALSDDQPYITKLFSQEKDIVIVNGGMASDFALMTLCLGGGVLSPSSFSWWGAYFCRENNKKATFIAPYYWGGHRKGAWYPESIKTNWMHYEEVY
ncbi:alpha-1,2-fucosyltransferase [Desulfobulbus sp. TB]|nr:alpha-1,2-fucosyltransferase [Desulfobulbus sp. TB]